MHVWLLQAMSATARQVAKVRELAERRVAQLNGRIQGLESRLHQLAEENRALASRAPAAQAGASPQVCPLVHASLRCPVLQSHVGLEHFLMHSQCSRTPTLLR